MGEEIQMANKHMKKKSSTSLIIKEMQIKKRCIFFHVTNKKKNVNADTQCWQGCGEPITHF